MDADDLDHRVRTAAFAFLAEQTNYYGDVVPRSVLETGFIFEATRVPLVGPQGIFKPAVLSSRIPLSINTVPIVEGRERPYGDEVGSEGFLSYRYRGTDAHHHENVGRARPWHRRRR